MGPQDSTRPIQLLAFVEATSLNAIGKNVLDFCRYVNDAGPCANARFDVTVVTFNRASADPNALEPSEFVKTARAQGTVVDIVGERFPFDCALLPALKKVIARRAPDIIATHNVKSHFLTRLCGLHHDRAWVAFHHGHTATDLKMRAYNELDRWSLRAADRVVAVCDSFARHLQSWRIPAERITTQHNSIGPSCSARAEEVLQIKERFGVGNGGRLVLSIGRLSREKAHVDLIAAFARVLALSRGIRPKLVIVGEGPERTAIELAVRAHGLQKSVFLSGHSTDVAPYYAAADAFVLPSHSEGSPYVLLEAMAAGIPIVATAVGGVPEILTSEINALLVKPQDAASLALAMNRILVDRELANRLSRNASTLVSTRYSLECYVQSVSRIYRSVLYNNADRGLALA
jgi:glycosyltransferase involved in cell wall biosynthesis